MERKKYLEMCQRASFKSHYSGAWWRAKWNPEELVQYQGNKFVPIDYKHTLEIYREWEAGINQTHS